MLETGARLRALKMCEVFSDMPPRDLGLLAEMMVAEKLGPGEELCHAGEPAEHVYVVVTGSLAVFLPNRDSPVRILGPGNVLGEYGLFHGRVRTATVRASAEAELLSLDYIRLHAFLRQSPSAALVLLETAVGRLIEAEMREAGQRV